MVKLFVGNLGDAFTVTSNELRGLFEKYGSVSECERVKNYAFVHMDDLNAAQDALNELNGTLIKGVKIRVEMSDRQGPKKASIKLFVGNLSECTTKEELRTLFETYTTVLEADVVKNFGFVHIEADEGKSKLNQIFRELNDYNLNGSQIRVQQSTSNVRQKPGMHGDQCFRCGLGGHWSKECPTNPEETMYSGLQGAYNVGRQLRGFRSGCGGGPIRNILPTYGNLRGRSFGGSNCSTFGGISFINRSGQNPYPQPLMPSYIQERNGYNTAGLPNSPFLEYSSRDQLETKTILHNRQGLSLADSYGRFFPQSNPIMIPSQHGNSNINSLSRQIAVSPLSFAGLTTNGRGMDSFARFSSDQESETLQSNTNGMRYTSFSNNDPTSLEQMSNISSGSAMSYPTPGLSQTYGSSFGGYEMH